MSSVEIRRAGPADVETLVTFNVAMAAETEDKPLDPRRLRKGISTLLGDRRHGDYFVAEGGGELAGALMVTYEWSDWRNGRFWWIQSVFVRPEWRRRGVYRALHGHVRSLAEADPSGCGIRLYVERDNRIAQSVYRTLGMHETVYRLFEEEL